MSGAGSAGSPYSHQWGEVVGGRQVLLHVLLEPGRTVPRPDQPQVCRSHRQVRHEQPGIGQVARRCWARSRAQQPGPG